MIWPDAKIGGRTLPGKQFNRLVCAYSPTPHQCIYLGFDSILKLHNQCVRITWIREFSGHTLNNNARATRFPYDSALELLSLEMEDSDQLPSELFQRTCVKWLVFEAGHTQGISVQNLQGISGRVVAIEAQRASSPDYVRCADAHLLLTGN